MENLDLLLNMVFILGSFAIIIVVIFTFMTIYEALTEIYDVNKYFAFFVSVLIIYTIFHVINLYTT